MLALTLALLTATPVLPTEWGEVRTEHFVLRHTPRAATATHQLAERIEHSRDEIERVMHRAWPGVTEVRVGVGREEYEGLAYDGPPPPPWATALAWPSRNVVLLDAMSLIQAEGETTLRHELVHVALGRIADGWPHWFQEGLAQHLTGEKQFSVPLATTMARAVQQKRIYDFRDLSAGFPPEPGDVEIAYAQSVVFVRFLMERHGPEAFTQLYEAMHEGLPFDGAFARAFHTTVHLEEVTLREQLPLRFSWWVLLLDGGWLWALNGPLLVFAWFRHRKAVKALRAAQAHQEALEDALLTLMMHARAANDAMTEVETSTGPSVVAGAAIVPVAAAGAPVADSPLPTDGSVKEEPS